MARTGISYEQVAAAADALVGEGQSNPTINAIRERLGTGSPNTIHRHLSTWNEARPQVPAPAPVLPLAWQQRLLRKLAEQQLKHARRSKRS